MAITTAKIDAAFGPILSSNHSRSEMISTTSPVFGSILFPGESRWGGGWHGGGWHGGGWRGGGGWGWGGFGVGLGTGLLLGAATAPYWGGYYGYGPYAYDYAYGPYGAYGGPYAGGPYYAAYGAPYAGGCYVTRRWVSDGYGHRVWRRVRVCR
jgi:hypothetical protein